MGSIDGQAPRRKLLHEPLVIASGGVLALGRSINATQRYFSEGDVKGGPNNHG